MLTNLLNIYRDCPMADGDVALVFVDAHLVTEVAGLANEWDPVLRRNLAHVLREVGVGEVQVAIARRGAELEPRDGALLGDLAEELAGSGIVLHPLVALPAA